MKDSQVLSVNAPSASVYVIMPTYNQGFFIRSVVQSFSSNTSKLGAHFNQWRLNGLYRSCYWRFSSRSQNTLLQKWKKRRIGLLLEWMITSGNLWLYLLPPFKRYLFQKSFKVYLKPYSKRIILLLILELFTTIRTTSVVV